MQFEIIVNFKTKKCTNIKFLSQLFPTQFFVLEFPIKATEKWKWMSLISSLRLFQLSRLINWTVPFWPMNWLIEIFILLIFYYSRNSRAYLYFFFFFYPPSIPPIRHMYFYLKFVLARHHIISWRNLLRLSVSLSYLLITSRPPARQPAYSSSLWLHTGFYTTLYTLLLWTGLVVVV